MDCKSFVPAKRLLWESSWGRRRKLRGRGSKAFSLITQRENTGPSPSQLPPGLLCKQNQLGWHCAAPRASQRYRRLGSVYQSLRHILRKKTPLFRHFATLKKKKSSYVKSVGQTTPSPQAKNKIKTNAFIKISEKAISLSFVRLIAQAHSSKPSAGSYFWRWQHFRFHEIGPT